MGHLGKNGKLRVRTATLDSLLHEEEIPAPDYIKMDIEGAELMALRGASECIQRHRPAIFLATHGRNMETECCRQLNSWGYELQSIGDVTMLDRAEFLAKFRP
jgi:hypothetical protein